MVLPWAQTPRLGYERQQANSRAAAQSAGTVLEEFFSVHRSLGRLICQLDRRKRRVLRQLAFTSQREADDVGTICYHLLSRKNWFASGMTGNVTEHPVTPGKGVQSPFNASVLSSANLGRLVLQERLTLVSLIEIAS